VGARFPEEIDEASLTAFFSFADDELEQIAAHRDIHGRLAIAVAVGALRWLGFVPAALEELPEPTAALIASRAADGTLSAKLATNVGADGRTLAGSLAAPRAGRRVRRSSRHRLACVLAGERPDVCLTVDRLASPSRPPRI